MTVDGEPLPHRSDLSGNATSAFDWGFVGTGQLSVALLSDFLGDDPKAKAMCDAFEKKVVAQLPHRSWTLTGQNLTDALAPLVEASEDLFRKDDEATGAAFGDMPVKTIMALANIAARGDGAQLPKEKGKSPEERATDLKAQVVTEAASEMANAAEQVAAAATAVGNAAHQVAHVHDGPADEPMSSVNRAADQKAAATNRAVDEAVALAHSAVDDANRVVAKLLPDPA